MPRPISRDPALPPAFSDEPALSTDSRQETQVRLEEPRKARVRRGDGADRAVAELAARQHGVVGRRQLRDLGLGERAVDHRVQSGRLHRIHQGVYAVGHPLLAREGRWLAAVIAGGAGAVLSHRSAAELWRLVPEGRETVEIVVPGDRRDRRGLILHQARLVDAERTEVRGIPVTTVERTLLDVAAVLDDRALRRAVHEAEVLRLWRPAVVDAALARHRGRRGTGRLAAIAAQGRLGADLTRSELELRFLELVADRRLPAPRANFSMSLGGRTVEADFAWPDRRLIVELDGHATHATRAGFERDRARDRVVQAAGWRVVRITWRQLHDHPTTVVRDLRQLLEG